MEYETPLLQAIRDPRQTFEPVGCGWHCSERHNRAAPQTPPGATRNPANQLRVPNAMRRLIWLIVFCSPLANAQPHYTPDKEMALGQQLASEFERHATIISDPVTVAYIDRIVGKLTTSVELRASLTIKLISGPDAYAITLPGGFIDVNTTLILKAANEAELAGVIAHQIGHLALWPVTPSETPMIGTIPLLFVGGLGGLCIRGTAEAGLAMPMGYLAGSREGEAKADELGLGYLESAGYDPGALADFYERMPRPKVGSVSRVFDPGRIMPEKTRTQAEIMRNARTFVVTTSEFEEIRQRVAALPSAGAKTGDSQPSLKNQAGK